MLKLPQVRQLVLAADGGSFRAAAEATFRSPAAVSIAMRELEVAIGGQLVERSGRGRLTPLAHALLPQLRELLALHDAVFAQARQLAQGYEGTLTVAVAPFLAEEWLPDVVARFAEEHPDVCVQTVEERSSHLCDLIGAGGVDIGVGGLLEDDPNLAIEPIAIDRYGVLCSSAHPLARRATATWHSLGREKLIGSDALQVLVDAGRAPPLPPPHLVITSRAPLLACVRRNLGVTIMPSMTRPVHDDGFAFVPLVRPTLARTVSIVTRRSRSLLPAGRTLVRLIAQSLREFARLRGAVLVGPADAALSRAGARPSVA
ncbi:MAG: LysR family transcriptional regulator [Proteobacteria bacterium]|nr:LysR family transcriptional regulator [Pseudomonadota bacterium]